MLPQRHGGRRDEPGVEEEDGGEAEDEEQRPEHEPPPRAPLEGDVGQAGHVAEEARDERQHAGRGERDEARPASATAAATTIDPVARSAPTPVRPALPGRRRRARAGSSRSTGPDTRAAMRPCGSSTSVVGVRDDLALQREERDAAVIGERGVGDAVGLEEGAGRSRGPRACRGRGTSPGGPWAGHALPGLLQRGGLLDARRAPGAPDVEDEDVARRIRPCVHGLPSRVVPASLTGSPRSRRRAARWCRRRRCSPCGRPPWLGPQRSSGRSSRPRSRSARPPAIATAPQRSAVAAVELAHQAPTDLVARASSSAAGSE